MNKQENDNTNDPFKVYIRIRPLLSLEISLMESQIDGVNQQINPVTLITEENKIHLIDPNQESYMKKEKIFAFDEIFKEKDDNRSIFDKIVKSQVENFLQGYNATILAYGVTGTGKTHTMFGDIYSSLNLEKGICMYAIDYLFDKICTQKDKSFKVKVSYLEIYNEQVIDLLTEKKSTDSLMIVEDQIKGISVVDLTDVAVLNSDDVSNLISMGNSRRVMAATGINQVSSRSHAILQISIEQRNNMKDEVMSSKLLLVDLAGSERGGLEKGIRREEGSNINKSLLALGNCINLLSDKFKKGTFVPYRDSKLTRLLKDSLGGNITTIMIVCVSPSPLTYEETLNTLKYATRATKISKRVTKNIKDPLLGQNSEMILGLKLEIEQLREIIKNQNILLRLKPSESYKKDYGNFSLSMKNSGIKYDADEDDIGINNFLDENDSFLKKIAKNRNMNKTNRPVLLSSNFETYEKFLNQNLNNITEEEFDQLEKQLENLYYDKTTLEDKIQEGITDDEINEKYTIIKSFYEKYIRLLCDKLTENIEQNLILKLNLKEILESNQKKDIVQDKEENTPPSFEDIQQEKDNIVLNLEKNIKAKNFLTKLMFKFFSSTQMKEIRDLQLSYTCLYNEKRELEVKNKKYQEFLNTILKDKDEKLKKIHELTKENEKLKRKCSEKDKRCFDLQRRLKESEANYRNEQKKTRLGSVGYVRNKFRFRDDTDIKLRKDSVYSKRNSNLNNSVTNNYISINLNSKIPIVQAFLSGGDVFPSGVSTVEPNGTGINTGATINKLKSNLSVKKVLKTQIDPTLESMVNNIIPQNIVGRNANIQVRNKGKESANKKELSNKKENVVGVLGDSISISAVTCNNEAILNTSELEIMENVLNLDGINPKKRKKQSSVITDKLELKEYIAQSDRGEKEDIVN